MCMCVCGGQSITLGVSLQKSILLLFLLVFVLETESLACLVDWPVSPGHPPVSASQCCLTSICHHP